MPRDDAAEREDHLTPPARERDSLEPTATPEHCLYRRAIVTSAYLRPGDQWIESDGVTLCLPVIEHTIQPGDLLEAWVKPYSGFPTPPNGSPLMGGEEVLFFRLNGVGAPIKKT